jgi:integrase
MVFVAFVSHDRSLSSSKTSAVQKNLMPLGGGLPKGLSRRDETSAGILPIAKSTRRLLQAWLKENDLKPEQPLLPNRFGHPLSRSGVAHQLQVAVTMATPGCPSLGKRKISPHQVRHTTALHMLQRGVRLEVIALWLGHEKLDTTHHYLEADLAMKEKALASLHLPKAKNPRFQPPDELLDFLEHL